MSASLENVQRGDTNLAVVTSLRGAVRAWQQLDPQHQAPATLTPEHAIQIDGVSGQSFSVAAIATLAEQLELDVLDARDAPTTAWEELRARKPDGGTGTILSHSRSCYGSQDQTYFQI